MEKTTKLILIIAVTTIIFKYPKKAKTNSKNKLEWLRVGVVLNWKSPVKEDWIEPLNQDIDPLE